MSDLDRWLEETQARCDAATEGPWKVGPVMDENGDEIAGIYLPGEQQAAIVSYAIIEDDAFIANARTDLPRALVIIRQMKAALESAIGESEAFAELDPSNRLVCEPQLRAALEWTP